MAYVSVDVDIDLDELDTDDLVEEICARMKCEYRNKNLSEKDKEKLRETFAELAELFIENSNGIEINNIDDVSKIEHIKSIFHKYSLSQIENSLPLY